MGICFQKLMPHIGTTEMLEKIEKGDFQSIRLRGLQDGTFCLLLECEDGTFIHENPDGSVKYYPGIDHALIWLKRKAGVVEVIVHTELWKEYKRR